MLPFGKQQEIDKVAEESPWACLGDEPDYGPIPLALRAGGGPDSASRMRCANIHGRIVYITAKR